MYIKRNKHSWVICLYEVLAARIETKSTYAVCIKYEGLMLHRQPAAYDISRFSFAVDNCRHYILCISAILFFYRHRQNIYSLHLFKVFLKKHRVFEKCIFPLIILRKNYRFNQKNSENQGLSFYKLLIIKSKDEVLNIYPISLNKIEFTKRSH